MKYAHLNNENRLLGFYSKDIHKIIPTPNIKVTDEVWRECVNNNYNYYNTDTKKFEVKDFRSDEEKLKEEIRKIKYEGKDFKLKGKTYKISFTKEDQDALVAIKVAFEDFGLTETNFKFYNGTSISIDKENFGKLAKFFVENRSQFFK